MLPPIQQLLSIVLSQAMSLQSPTPAASLVLAPVSSHCVNASAKDTGLQHPDNLEASVDHEQHQIPDDVISIAATVLYGQEPFETFQHKVAEFATKHFRKSPQNIKLHPMKGGSFNRVVGITISSKPKKSGLKWFLCRCLSASKKERKATFDSYILRIPRIEYGGDDADENMANDMKHEVTILNTIGSRLPLPIPKVFSYELTTTSVFERPYMIQTRLPGQNLWLDLWDHLNFQQKQCVVRYITNLPPLIALVEGPAGDISTENLSRSSASPVHVETFYTRPYDDQPKSKPALIRRPIDHLLERCEQWRACERSTGFCFEKIWDNFEAISRALEMRGFLHGPCVLVHGDLKAYNLLAKVCSDTEVDITGVIDWDSAIIAPEFMAYRAPFWLWTPRDMNSEKADEEHMANFEPIDDEDKKLKQVFLENASEKYKLYAFAPEAMLARRMFRILKESLSGEWEHEEARSVIREWNELHPEDGVQYADSNTESESDADEDDLEQPVGVAEICIACNYTTI
ncbi:hypothetical protein G6011_02092 [Alternaria panax]|uniref:Aminoglycoside phosphotransferase domain-containing protein n=1 Tax=Alternaria panax TaxID=48097 RepID=A0AAD4FCW9_9PLEO|nr:hypothetical protein G6011_02092 [Alternaria panax]